MNLGLRDEKAEKQAAGSKYSIATQAKRDFKQFVRGHLAARIPHLCVANLRNSRLLRSVCAVKTSPGAMFRASPDGVRRMDAPNSCEILIRDPKRAELLEVP